MVFVLEFVKNMWLVKVVFVSFLVSLILAGMWNMLERCYSLLVCLVSVVIVLGCV